jgi:hypothetical protein
MQQMCDMGRLRPGLNLRTWVLKGSTLPLDNRSRSPQCSVICTFPVLFNSDNTENGIQNSAECAESRYASGHDITEFNNDEHLGPFASYQMLKGNFLAV